MTATLSAAQAGRIAAHGRRLLRQGDITHREQSLLEVLLWQCRGHGSAIARASYTRLSDLARVSRDTVARGIRKLEDLGVIRKTKTWLRVRWMLGVARRQGVNLYELIEPAVTESDNQTVNKALRILVACEPTKEALKAQKALEDIRLRREWVLKRRGWPLEG
jgi:DNA-binding Lrp family transcriptional regulator